MWWCGAACGRQMPGPAGMGGFSAQLEHRSSLPSTVLATVTVFNESRIACLSSAPCCFCTPASRTIPETHAAALRRAARQADSAKLLKRTKLSFFISSLFPSFSLLGRSSKRGMGCSVIKLPFQMLCLTSPIWLPRETSAHLKPLTNT